MKQSEIPLYFDPDTFEEIEAIYPCSTQLMEYKTLVSKYYLTVEGLQDYGVDTSIKEVEGTNALKQFIRETTEDLYGVIARIAPFNYEYNCWLIAQSISAQFPKKYACRKQFEEALIYQAQYKLINFDVRDINGIDLEGGQSIYFKQLRKEFRHISPKAIDKLQALGVLFNGYIPTKRLINYKEGM